MCRLVLTFHGCGHFKTAREGCHHSQINDDQTVFICYETQRHMTVADFCNSNQPVSRVLASTDICGADCSRLQIFTQLSLPEGARHADPLPLGLLSYEQASRFASTWGTLTKVQDIFVDLVKLFHLIPHFDLLADGLPPTVEFRFLVMMFFPLSTKESAEGDQDLRSAYLLPAIRARKAINSFELGGWEHECPYGRGPEAWLAYIEHMIKIAAQRVDQLADLLNNAITQVSVSSKTFEALAADANRSQRDPRVARCIRVIWSLKHLALWNAAKNTRDYPGREFGRIMGSNVFDSIDISLDRTTMLDEIRLPLAEIVFQFKGAVKANSLMDPKLPKTLGKGNMTHFFDFVLVEPYFSPALEAYATEYTALEQNVPNYAPHVDHVDPDYSHSSSSSEVENGEKSDEETDDSDYEEDGDQMEGVIRTLNIPPPSPPASFPPLAPCTSPTSPESASDDNEDNETEQTTLEAPSSSLRQLSIQPSDRKKDVWDPVHSPREGLRSFWDDIEADRNPRAALYTEDDVVADTGSAFLNTYRSVRYVSALFFDTYLTREQSQGLVNCPRLRQRRNSEDGITDAPPAYLPRAPEYTVDLAPGHHRPLFGIAPLYEHSLRGIVASPWRRMREGRDRSRRYGQRRWLAATRGLRLGAPIPSARRARARRTNMNMVPNDIWENRKAWRRAYVVTRRNHISFCTTPRQLDWARVLWHVQIQ